MAELSTELKELEKTFDGDADLLLFFITWIKNGLNATKAYLEIHPDCSYHSATVLGSRWLGRVSKETVLQAYGLDVETYFTQLKEGLQATRPIAAAIYVQKDGKTVRSANEGAIEVPDHYARKPYHDKLGRLLGLEGKIELNQSFQQNNYYHVKDEQFKPIIDTAGIKDASTQELVEILVETGTTRTAE